MVSNQALSPRIGAEQDALAKRPKLHLEIPHGLVLLLDGRALER
jgi:hypothetical protein